MGTAASDPKPFASLGPMLLARKGTAKPAMRVQLEQSDRTATLGDEFDEIACSQDALGWNDMGMEDNDNRVVHLPVSKTRKHAKTQSKSAAPAKARAAFTLRLDPERHLKLRLASTMQEVSAQVLVTEALDRFLADIPELEAIAAHMRDKANNA